MGIGTNQPLVYSVFFTKRCEKRYSKLQASEKREIGRTIEQIQSNPRTGYPLQDPVLKDLYSIHSGNFRIVYKFTDDPAEIELWAIELRKHVYEELMRYRSIIHQVAEAAPRVEYHQ